MGPCLVRKFKKKEETKTKNQRNKNQRTKNQRTKNQEPRTKEPKIKIQDLMRFVLDLVIWFLKFSH